MIILYQSVMCEETVALHADVVVWWTMYDGKRFDLAMVDNDSLTLGMMTLLI